LIYALEQAEEHTVSEAQLDHARRLVINVHKDIVAHEGDATF
jgi:hypothetical protein